MAEYISKMKSVLLSKSEIENGYNLGFYNPVWGRFAIEYKYDRDNAAMNNLVKLLRVGDYALIHGKPTFDRVNGEVVQTGPEIREFDIVKYMKHETEEARKSGRELAVPNMTALEMNNLANNLLKQLKQIKQVNQKQ